MSQAGAEWWTNLAVDLQWRLPATGQALRDGIIDLARAKAIAEATGPARRRESPGGRGQGPAQGG